MLPLILNYINEGDHIIDAGAYIGDHTIAYSNKCGISGLVHAFEPNEEAFECLTHNMSGRKNVLCYRKGLGSANVKKGMVKVSGNDGMNHLCEGSEIEIITIDSLKLKKLDFIKIDVEGYELEVLLGARNSIQLFKPKMLIEINEYTLVRKNINRNTIYKWLDNAGYSFKNIFSGQSLDEFQMDLICINKEILTA